MTLGHENLNASEERFRQLANAVPQIVCVCDAEGNAEYLNDRWYDYVGVTAGDSFALDTAAHIYPLDLERIQPMWEEAKRQRTIFEAELRIRDKNGRYRWFLTRTVPQLAAGVCQAWYGTSTDIHEQKIASQAIARAREELHSFFMQAPAPMVILTGPDHLFTLVNPLYEKYVGREVQGKTVREAFTSEEAGYYVPLLDRVYRTGEPFVGRDLPLSLPDENGVPQSARIDVSYTPFREDDGRVKGILVFVHDVTTEYNARVNMRRYNEDLRSAKEESERANQLKSAFLANMSHEIRTPLGAMIGFADLLREPGLTESQRTGYIDILARNGENLSVILNDILDLSKVEAGQLTLEFTAASPKEIAGDIVSLMLVKAEAKKLALTFEHDSTTPVLIFTDPTRLRQILLNIVGNAIKFTANGGIKIRSFGMRSAAGAQTVCFEISDTGIGIPEGQESRVFEMFVQADVQPRGVSAGPV